MGLPNWGEGLGRSPTWEKFRHFPVFICFFFGNVPYKNILLANASIYHYKQISRLSLVATSTSTATTVESLKTSVATLEDTISSHATSITAHGKIHQKKNKIKREGFQDHTLYGIFLEPFPKGRGKKNWKSGQADRFFWGGGSPPSSLTKTICENFRPFFPLNMIPWYPKQILIHC